MSIHDVQRRVVTCLLVAVLEIQCRLTDVCLDRLCCGGTCSLRIISVSSCFIML
jgi:hypothetical protein